MLIKLTTEETELLLQHLAKRAEQMDSELVHTDKRELQRSLAEDLRALRALESRIRDAERAPQADEERSP